MEIKNTPEQLAKAVIDHIAEGDKAGYEHYREAGLLLIEGRRRCKSLHIFLKYFPKPLKRTRALELIAIAKGSTTPNEICAKANERKKRHREKQASVPERTIIEMPPPTPAPVVSLAASRDAGVDPRATPINQFKTCVCLWFEKMDLATRKEAAAFAVKMAEPDANLDRSAA